MMLGVLSKVRRFVVAEGPSFVFWFYFGEVLYHRQTPTVAYHWLWQGVAVSILLGALKAYYRQWKRAVIAESRLAEKPETRRTFVQNPREVLSLYWQPGYDALQKVAPVIGQWICVSGYFQGEAERLTRDGYHVTLRQECGRVLHLVFPKAAEESVKSLRRAQMVIAICKVNYGPSLLLEDCEIVESRPATKVRCA
ncbi:MAG TPA: hypothetical protein VN736_24245 [Candidatus Limnocylindrales bacterium]|nr:hypothetical protein [Candidatus Limnocylindrales bacterium]